MVAALCPDEQRAWRAYIEASIRLETRLDEALRAGTGLTLIDYHLLVLLSEAPQHRLRMNELADSMVFSRSRITYQVNSLARRGHVVREPAPDDGRGYRAVLTATGYETLRRAAVKHAASVRELFLANLEPDELACMGRAFTRLGERLKAAEDRA
ncbi:MarR family transcriptional regulator [Mycobacterium sp. 852002-51163_SCH5372311]|uniref:MarR family winged helix-turn-helix transcriptional regulator n=1 Tax=Mycobacterium sp. 852002-51163_SCH5372311 TaxID=1834097 RepID=UPI000800DEEB|nr:MarR family transcriptional regulator [Mycobacterium sp. 852002-51163_SCH5372311]OBF86131.1 MarR family transcriptional regulator [Mycobacterium sp. 852002-51163_SCH5372311]